MSQDTQSLEGEHSHAQPMNPERRGRSLALCAMLLLVLVPIHAHASPTPSVDISVQWIAEGDNPNAHAYLLTFSDNGTYEFDVTLDHRRNGSPLSSTSTIEWGSSDDKRTALVTFNTSLAWGDEILLSVNITVHDGQAVNVQTVRELVVGLWNQPMDDHEVMLSSTWSLEQAYTDGIGPQRFALMFSGQGWQERVGDVLSSWELGNGTFETLETTTEGQSDLDLVLTQLWKNETIVAGVLTHQVFDARGFGTLETMLVDGATETLIHADVSQAELNRSYAEGVVSERLLLEATGTLDVTEDGVENNTLEIDGELAVFFFEYEDMDGVRVFQYTQFEAMADLVIIDDGTRLDVSLDGFRSIEQWEDGVRTEQLEELYGRGTFGFADQDENASVQVNGTILDLHTKIENGTTVIDDLHVDGVLTGDVQGTFGVVRGIETTGMQTNATGEAFLVNVIFQESWFNITGVNGGNFFDGAGVGATHNETWDYQVVNADWENRTVRLVWRETGPDASEGESFPEHSPVQRNATPPASEEGLGDLTVGRETGLMPIPMRPHDRFLLDGQEGLELTVVAGAITIDARDGHNLTVIDWTGEYGGGATGNANGSIVSVGPLSGLLTNIQRALSLPFGEENETIVLQESQLLERVLSPEIVGEDENNAPFIASLGLREGLVVGEGGSVAHLEAVVTDTEWNVVHVEVDASSIGAGLITLNDRGVDGDQAIGDDVYTAAVWVQGLEVGERPINVSAVDSFGRSTQFQGVIVVVNQAPRLLDVELAPAALERGQSIIINAQAYDGHGVSSVELDLREYGGSVENLTLTDGIWAAMVAMPSGMTPGEESLRLVVTDGLGASEAYRTYTPRSGPIGDTTRGPHHVNFLSTEDIEVQILNDRPVIEATSQTVVKETDVEHVFTVQVQDPDGIERVQVNLGVYAPIGETSWVMMHDDGVNGGDEVAGDGVYSVILSVRDGTPLGVHEVSVRSFDTYGELNMTSTTIKLVEETTPTGTNDGLGGTVLLALGAAVMLGAVLVLLVMWRRREGDGEQNDRFGFQ